MISNKNSVIIIVFICLGLFLINGAVLAATWQEPDCDPNTDPGACSVAPPLNTSSDSQSKAGDLTFESFISVDDIRSITGDITINADGTISIGSPSATVNMDGKVNITSGGLLLPTNSSTAEDGSVYWDGASDKLMMYDGDTSNWIDVSTPTDVWVDEAGDDMTGPLTVTGTSTDEMVYVEISENTGIRALTGSGQAVRGTADVGIGVSGNANNTGGYGVRGSAASGYGVYGRTQTGIAGVYGESSNTYGVYADGATGIYAKGTTWAADFDNDVNIRDYLEVGGASYFGGEMTVGADLYTIGRAHLESGVETTTIDASGMIITPDLFATASVSTPDITASNSVTTPALTVSNTLSLPNDSVTDVMVEDAFVKNTGDTMTGSLTITDNHGITLYDDMGIAFCLKVLRTEPAGADNSIKRSGIGFFTSYLVLRAGACA